MGPAPYHGRHASVTSGFYSRDTAFEHDIGNVLERDVDNDDDDNWPKFSSILNFCEYSSPLRLGPGLLTPYTTLLVIRI